MIFVEAICHDCNITFNPTGEEEHDPPEHYEKEDGTPCESTNTEIIGQWVSARSTT